MSSGAAKSPRDVPFDIAARIVRHVDTKASLSVLMRVSKSFMMASIPALYESVTITADTRILVDSGLASAGLNFASEAGIPEAVPVETRRDGTDHETGQPSAKTLKQACLESIRDLTLKWSIQIPNLPFSDPNEASSWMTDQFSTLSNLHTLRFDLTAYNESDPVRGHLELRKQSSVFRCVVNNLRPRRWIIIGHMSYPDLQQVMIMDAEHCSKVQEVIMLITREAGTPGDTWLRANDGSLSHHSFTLAPAIREIPPNIPITAILTPETQSPHQKVKVGDFTRFTPMAMTMEFHPDYAPGYLHGWTSQLGAALAYKRCKLTLVNFGILDGEEFGMPQASVGEVEDRMKRGLRVRYQRSMSQVRYADLQGGMAPITEDEAHERLEEVRVIGMRHWLKEREDGGRGVLYEETLDAWRA